MSSLFTSPVRRVRTILAVILLVGVMPASIAAQTWTRAYGPGGAHVTAIAIDPWTPSTLHVGTEGGGVFKSTDAGARWTPSGLADVERIWAFAVDTLTTTTVYAATSAGVMKSTDAGHTWRTVTESRGYYALVIDPWTPSTVYAGGGANRMMKSLDGGETWWPLGLWFPTAVTSLALDLWNPSTLYAGTSQYAYKSVDGGLHWRQITYNQQETITDIDVDLWDPAIVYLKGNRTRIRKSTNAGDTWAFLNTPNGVDQLVIDSDVHTTVYAASSNHGMWKSIDGGGSWSALETGLTSRYVTALAADPLTPTTIYIGTEGRGVFKSLDAGATWQPMSAGMSATLVHDMVLDPWSSGVVYTAGDAGVNKTVNHGESWQPRNTGLTAGPPDGSNTTFSSITSVVLDLWAPGTLYVGTNGDGVRKTENGGSTWHAAGLPEEHIVSLALDPYRPGTIYAGTSFGLFKSTDGGGQWDLAPRFNNLEVRSLQIDPSNPDVLYGVLQYSAICGTGFPLETCPRAQVLKSTDAGVTFTTLPIPTQAALDGVVAIDPLTPTTVYASFKGTNQSFKSTDGGANWVRLDLAVSVSAIAIDPVVPSTLYVGSWTSGVWKSTDAGGHWIQITDGLTDLEVRSLLVDRWKPALSTPGRRLQACSF